MAQIGVALALPMTFALGSEYLFHNEEADFENLVLSSAKFYMYCA